MSWWNAKYKNGHGEYEITFASKDYEKAKVVEKICQAIIDKRIKSREDLQPLFSGWISVEERLPTEKDASPNKSVLAIDIHDGFAREWVRESVVLYPDSFTHWMPLPEPPKEDT